MLPGTGNNGMQRETTGEEKHRRIHTGRATDGRQRRANTFSRGANGRDHGTQREAQRGRKVHGSKVAWEAEGKKAL